MPEAFSDSFSCVLAFAFSCWSSVALDWLDACECVDVEPFADPLVDEPDWVCVDPLLDVFACIVVFPDAEPLVVPLVEPFAWTCVLTVAPGVAATAPAPAEASSTANMTAMGFVMFMGRTSRWPVDRGDNQA